MRFETCRLGDISDIVDSLHKTPKYADKGKPMVRVTDVKYGPLRLDSTYKVDDKVFEEFSRRYSPSVGDIVITRVGSYGNTAYVTDPDFCLGQNTAAVIPKINPRYLYLALNSRQLKEQIEFSTVGSTQKTLSLKAISNLQIPRFTAEFEDFVAKTCGQLDDKIQLNHQINQTLEQMAQAIFKSWFVDFEPVKAKIAAKESWQALQAEGEAESLPDLETWMNLAAMQVISGQTEAALNQMADQQPEQFSELFKTAALFPAAMQDSELGEIPEGWNCNALENLCTTITKGTTPKRSELAAATDDAIVHFIKVKDITGTGEIIREGLELIPDSISRKSLKRSILKNGDLLFSIAGTIGRVAIVDATLEDSNTNQAVGIIRLSEQEKHLALVWQTLLSERVQNEIRSKVVQGVQANASLKSLRDIQVISPCDKLLYTASSHLSVLLKEISSIHAQSRNLTELRDTLLPKLLSGELSVADLELEEA